MIKISFRRCLCGGIGSIAAAARRAYRSSTCFFSDAYAFDRGRRELRRHETLVPLTPRMFDLLEHLLRNGERVVSKDELVSTIWRGRAVTDSTLTTRINAVRAAVGDHGNSQWLPTIIPITGPLVHFRNGARDLYL